MRLLLTALMTVLPLTAYSTTVPEIISNIQAHQDAIESLKTEFTMETKGLGKEMQKQKGTYTYTSTNGSVLEYTEPSAMRVLMMTNGDIFVNGVRQKGGQQSTQAGDLFMRFYLDNYDLKVDSENKSIVLLSGYERTADIRNLGHNRLLSLRYDKKLKVIDAIQYMGGGYDYPYDIKVTYGLVQGVPVLNSMTMRMAMYNVSVVTRFGYTNTELVRKAE